MIDPDELVLAGGEFDPAFARADRADHRAASGRRTGRCRDYIRRSPMGRCDSQLLPTMHDLVDYGRAIDRDRPAWTTTDQPKRR